MPLIGIVTNSYSELRGALEDYWDEKSLGLQADDKVYKSIHALVIPETLALNTGVLATVELKNSEFKINRFMSWLEAEQEAGYYEKLKAAFIEYDIGNDMLPKAGLRGIKHDGLFLQALDVAKQQDVNPDPGDMLESMRELMDDPEMRNNPKAQLLFELMQKEAGEDGTIEIEEDVLAQLGLSEEQAQAIDEPDSQIHDDNIKKDGKDESVWKDALDGLDFDW